MSVVGIDLGTTNTVVASVRAGKVHVLADKEGMRLLPSIVSFHPNGGVLVGAAARARRVIDPRNTVYSHKRLIGRSWNSPEIAQARRRVAFELREGRGQGSLVHARGQDFTLPEISAFVLKRARQIAEQALGTPVERAVITVPAHFNELQRSSTKVAGRVSGLEVLRILNEPTAAALAYGLGRSGNERVAVYDFGGGTFDCTLLDLNGNVFEVLATAGDSFLGGDDVDALIADRMAEAFLKQHRQDARQAPEMHERLKLAAEEIKVALSTAEAHAVTLEEFGHGAGGASLRFHFSMTRKDLESLLAPLVDRTFKVTEDALALARLAPTSFDKVILVGGSTRIPLVRRRVEAFFGGPTMDRVNPDEVVAIGAAIQAAALTEGARRRSIPAAPPVLGRASQGERQDDTYTSELGAETLPDRSAPPSTQKTAFASEPPSFGFQPGSGGRAGSFPDLSPPTPFEWSPASAFAAPASGGAPDSRSAPRLARGAPPPAAAKAKPAHKPGERTPNRRITAPTMSGTAPSPITPQPFGPMEKIEPAAPAAPARPVAAPPATARMPDAFMQLPAAPPATARMPDAFMQLPTAPPAYAPPAAAPQAAAPPPLPGWAPPSPIASPDAPPSQPPIFGAFPSAPPPGTMPSQPPIFGAFPSAPPLDPAHAGTFAAGAIPAAPPAPQHLEYRAPVLVDVTPRALVVETAGGYTNTIIPRNAKIPSERTRRFSTGRDMQTTVRVRVAQGESPGFDQNTFLGEVELSGLRPAVRGAVTIAVTFEVDADGTLRVRARDVDTGTEARATLQLVGIADESSVVMMINRFADWSDLGGG